MEQLLDSQFEEFDTSHHPTQDVADLIKSGDFDDYLHAALFLLQLHVSAKHEIQVIQVSTTVQTSIIEGDEAHFTTTTCNHESYKAPFHADVVQGFACMETASRLAVVEAIMYSLSSPPGDYNDLMCESTISSLKRTKDAIHASTRFNTTTVFALRGSQIYVNAFAAAVALAPSTVRRHA